MSDIARCNYKDCPQVNNCKRFRADAIEWQGYYINFSHLCFQPDYQYLIPKDNKPVEQNQEENKSN